MTVTAAIQTREVLYPHNKDVGDALLGYATRRMYEKNKGLINPEGKPDPFRRCLAMQHAVDVPWKINFYVSQVRLEKNKRVAQLELLSATAPGTAIRGNI